MTLSHKGRWFSGPFASCTYTHIMVSLWTLPLPGGGSLLGLYLYRPLKNFIINIFILSLTHTTISTEIQQTTPSSFSQTTFTGSDFHFVWKHWHDAKNPFIVIRIYATVVPKQKQTRDLLAFWNGNTYSLSVQHQIVQKSSRCFWWNWGIGLWSFWCIFEIVQCNAKVFVQFVASYLMQWEGVF